MLFRSSAARYIFRESNNGNVFSTLVRYPKSQVNLPYYTVLYNFAGTGWMTYQVGGQTLYSENLAINPNQGWASSETHTKADQMPGGTVARMQFFDAHLYIGGWQDLAGYGYNDDWAEFGLNGLNTRVQGASPARKPSPKSS